MQLRLRHSLLRHNVDVRFGDRVGVFHQRYLHRWRRHIRPVFALELLAVPFDPLERVRRQVEIGVRRVLLANQELGEPADGGAPVRVDADEPHRLGDDRAAIAELQDGEGFDGRGDGFDLIAGRSGLDFRDDLVRGERVAVRVRDVEPVGAVGVDDDIGQHAVEPVLELGAEPAHHRVHDDERRHAKHDADDADEREVASLQVADAEEQLVHGNPSPQCAHAGTQMRGACSKFDERGKGEVRTTCALRRPRVRDTEGADEVRANGRVGTIAEPPEERGEGGSSGYRSPAAG